ncbi:1,4-alpha-glucan-branching protein [Salmonella enterica subsp. enterica serovar Choleraesuis]|nr:1,4-alpha-glucan-branching protein [Salmonella enterica subsp. enterica serovar Choleraesuis]
MFIKPLLHTLARGKDIPFGDNDLRHILRIVAAGMTGLFIYTWVHTSFGVFYVVWPIMLTALVPVFNGHVARQMIANAVLNCIEMPILIGVLIYHPPLMTVMVFLLYMVRFYCMSRGPLFLFGSMGVVSLSIMPDFLSYPTSDFHDMLVSNLIGSVLAVLLSAIYCYLIPDVTPRQRPPAIKKEANRVMHETLLASIVATMLFIIFQVYTLSDSLAALMAGIFILFPMHYRGSIITAKWRIIGVTLGCLYGLAIQLIIYDYSNHLILMMPLISVGLIVAARIHVMEKVGAGVGFCILTTLGIMFGQYLHPNTDVVFTDMYRVVSVAVSIVCTLSVVYILHKVLNLFPGTRYVPES